MSEKDKKKLCWNCEGSVLRHIETCPYCGVYLSPTDEDVGSSSLLEPPFPKTREDEAIPDPLYASEESAHEDPSTDLIGEEKGRGFLYTLLMLVCGTSLALFGLSLWLFSEAGRLTLSWSDEWAPLFLLVALPLIALGSRRLISLKN